MSDSKINETQPHQAYSGLSAMSDKAIAADIGRRLERLRLEQNRTQQELADELGITRVSYRNLVKGNGKFVNIIALMRVLGELDSLNNLVPETAFSPLAQLEARGKQRQRAGRKPEPTPNPDDDLDW